MTVARFAISFEPNLARAVRRAAGREPTSAWLADAARAIAELCGRAKTKDVVDAQVAIVAASSEVLYTSDPEDMERLLRVYRGGAPTIVRC